MKILKHTAEIVEYLVVVAELSDPALHELAFPDHPNWKGWRLDRQRALPTGEHKIVLTRTRKEQAHVARGEGG